MALPPGQPVVQLRIGLKDITPIIWRRLLVAGSVRLAELHLTFQAAMGWTDSLPRCRLSTAPGPRVGRAPARSHRHPRVFPALGWRW